MTISKASPLRIARPYDPSNVTLLFRKMKVVVETVDVMFQKIKAYIAQQRSMVKI